VDAHAVVRSSASRFSLRFLGEGDGRLAEQRTPLAVRDLLGFESWLERGRVMMLDFSPEVVAFSSQPFWLTWPASGKLRRHARIISPAWRTGPDQRAAERLDSDSGCG